MPTEWTDGRHSASGSPAFVTEYVAKLKQEQALDPDIQLVVRVASEGRGHG